VIRIRPGRPEDAAGADAVMRDAFASMGEEFGDASLVLPRAAAYPEAFVVAESGGELAGSALGMRWGSLFVVGPVSVRPDLQGRGIGPRLMAALLDTARDVPHAALYTFADRPGHVRLYGGFGFEAQDEIHVLRRAPQPGPGCAVASEAEARALAGAVLAGLDLTQELRAATVTAGVDGGFAACQHGSGTEAGSARLRVKCAIARDAGALDALLDAVEALAFARGAPEIEIGVHGARTAAHGTLVERGYRTAFSGLAMHRGGEPLTARPDALVLDDWR
jgi:predicted N-acetyltransferase YhbS